MPEYKNIYLGLENPDDRRCFSLGKHSTPSGHPDITLTRVCDPDFSDPGFSEQQMRTQKTITRSMFENVISVGESCYLESTNRLAFHNNPIKLTSVKVNDKTSREK